MTARLRRPLDDFSAASEINAFPVAQAGNRCRCKEGFQGIRCDQFLPKTDSILSDPKRFYRGIIMDASETCSGKCQSAKIIHSAHQEHQQGDDSSRLRGSEIADVFRTTS
ncbi:pro-neuregulin-3, membrane-bound isoform [Tachysurus ichikawai]